MVKRRRRAHSCSSNPPKHLLPARPVLGSGVREKSQRHHAHSLMGGADGHEPLEPPRKRCAQGRGTEGRGSLQRGLLSGKSVCRGGESGEVGKGITGRVAASAGAQKDGMVAVRGLISLLAPGVCCRGSLPRDDPTSHSEHSPPPRPLHTLAEGRHLPRATPP